MSPSTVAPLFRRVSCNECEQSVRINQHARHIKGHDLFSRVDASGECWLWTGEINRAGYGTANPTRLLGRRGTRLAHRLVWEKLVGPIPEGMTLDHLCRVRNCVNPDHLEPVTAAENIRRGYSPGARAFRSGTCVRGHERNETNMHIDPRSGARQCRACLRDRLKAKREARRVLAA